MDQLRRFRLLIFVALVALAAGYWERSRVRPQATARFDPYQQLSPPPDATDVLVSIFPDRPDSDYLKAEQALFYRFDLVEAERHLAEVLKKVKSNESYFYHYIVVLLMSGADEKKVEQAVRQWRWHFPYSTEADPRVKWQRRTFPLPKPMGAVSSMALDEGSQRLVTGAASGQMEVLDLQRRRPSMRLRAHAGEVTAMAWMPDGKRLISTSDDGLVQIWDMDNSKSLLVFQTEQRGVYGMAVSPDGRLVATAGLDARIRIWKTSDGAPVSSLDAHQRPVSAVAFSKDGSQLASGDWDGIIRLWTVHNRDSDDVAFELTATLAGQKKIGHTGVIYDLRFSDQVADQAMLLSASRDGRAIVWDVAQRKLKYKLVTGRLPLFAARFTPDGTGIVTAGSDRQVRLWNAADGQLVRKLYKSQGPIYCLAIASNKTVYLGGVGAVETITLSHKLDRQQAD